LLDLPDYVASLAQRVATTGADVVVPRIEYTRGALSAQLFVDGELPGSGIPRTSMIHVVERWSRSYLDRPWRLDEYAYELLDHERDLRIAFHLHDAEWFVANHRVVVHEHCERPIGVSRCQHYAGTPIAGGFEALDRLMAAWVSDSVEDCSLRTCL